MVGTNGWIVMATLTVGSMAAGCGKDDKGGGTASQPARPAPGGAEARSPAAPAGPTADIGAWKQGDVGSFRAAWTTHGAATKDATLTGTLYVGPKAVRLDVDKLPGSGPRSYVRVHGENDLWQINVEAKTYVRALSGDWEHNVIPRVVEDVDDLAAGKCPFGRASAEDCQQLGAEQVASRAVQTWKYKNRTLWVDPTLRVSLKEEYTPYRNNPKTQVVELSKVEPGEQDPALFTMPAGFECGAGAFCDSAPK
jgi:hypothetical protein